jgi:hypothetical protein
LNKFIVLTVVYNSGLPENPILINTENIIISRRAYCGTNTLINLVNNLSFEVKETTGEIYDKIYKKEMAETCTPSDFDRATLSGLATNVMKDAFPKSAKKSFSDDPIDAESKVTFDFPPSLNTTDDVSCEHCEYVIYCKICNVKATNNGCCEHDNPISKNIEVKCRCCLSDELSKCAKELGAEELEKTKYRNVCRNSLAPEDFSKDDQSSKDWEVIE